MRRGFFKNYVIIIFLATANSICLADTLKDGEKAFERDDFSQAVKHYQDALSEKKSIRAYLGLANAHGRLGQWSKAADAYRSAIEMQAKVPDITLLKNLGKAEYMSDQFESALNVFESAYARQPDHDIAMWLARCFIKTEQWTRAEYILLEVVAKGPDDSPALELLAYLFTQSGKINEAVGIHEKLVRMHPDNTEYYLALAKAQTAAKDYSQAIDTLEFLTRLKIVSPPEAIRLLADLYINRNMYRNAALCYRKIIINSQSPSVEDYFRLGYTYFQNGEYLSAEKTFEQIKQQKPADSRAPLYLGRIAEKRGETKKARQFYLDAIQIDKTVKQLHLLLADMEYKNENFARAAVHYSEAMSIGTPSADIHYNHILSLILSEQFGTAKTAVKEALKEYPESQKINNC